MSYSSNLITVNGLLYTWEIIREEKNGITEIAVWTDNNQLICDIELNSRTHIGEVSYRDNIMVESVNYQKYLQDISTLNSEKSAMANLVSWAIDLEE